ncbi:hypothetical protein [Stackebrandtia soli]|uniref:hypothetical protein n=1 Tax=Stackebrandtia soli TaxID=1892856 RepID=UPI0039ECFA10
MATTRDDDGRPRSSPDPGRVEIPDDASELDELAHDMEWERWRDTRHGPPWRLVAWLAAAVIVTIVSLVMLIVLGHAGWTPLGR